MADDRQGDGDELDRRIAGAKANQPGAGITAAQARAEGRGWAIGIEFVGTVLVCALIGWGMIVLLLLGFAAGTRRAMVTSAQFDATPRNDAR